MKRTVPLSIPNFEGNEKKYADEAIEQGWVSTGGPFIERLESCLAEYLRVEEVAACQSGTAALHLSLVESGVQYGDMVIVPALTFIAAVNPVRYQYAEPVFMDCDDSLCMDPIKLRRFCEEECRLENGRLLHIQSGKVVKAVIVVHVFGNLADMEQIMEIAKVFHLKVIEDATEALGSYYTEGRYAGKYAGTIGDFGAYSFNGNKIITTGGGGAVTARGKETVCHMRFLSTQAKADSIEYVHSEVGYNYRMTNVQAAIGVAQMEELEEFISRKERNYLQYQGLLQDIPGVEFLGFRENTRCNRWFYSLRIDNGIYQKDMSTIVQELQDVGVQTRRIWGLIHQQLPYQNCIAYHIHKAIDASLSILNIPSTTQLSEEDIKYVARQLKAVLGC